MTTTVGRTNIEIDDELIARVIDLYGFHTKREAVEYALRELDFKPMTKEEALAMQGFGWHGDLDAMRSGEDPIEVIWPDRAEE